MIKKVEKRPIGRQIINRLKALKWTQAELSKKSGIKAQNINKYVKGERSPNGESIVALAQALGVTSDYLLGLSSTAEESEVQTRYLEQALRDAKFKPDIASDLKPLISMLLLAQKWGGVSPFLNWLERQAFVRNSRTPSGSVASKSGNRQKVRQSR